MGGARVVVREAREMSTEDGPEVHRVRLTAREWLRRNMTRSEQAEDEKYRQRTQPRSDESRVAHARQLQARLYDAGYAGLTYPAEYGDAGLSLDHERAFF